MASPGLTLPISGVVSLHADDGFEMARQNADAFTRQTYENGVLMLTNEPEPELLPELEPIDPTPTVEQDLMALSIDHEYRITLLELGGF